MNPVTSFLVFVLAAGGLALGYRGDLYLGIPMLVLAVLVSASLKMANVWQKFVILRMGKLQSVKGAGLFAIIPVIDSVVAVIDGRIQTTAFNAERALTKDTVPVNVDAIIFWHEDDRVDVDRNRVLGQRPLGVEGSRLDASIDHRHDAVDDRNDGEQPRSFYALQLSHPEDHKLLPDIG